MILATIAVFAAVLGLTRMASQPGLSLLYAGLETGAAGEVVRALEQQGVVYEVRSGAIYVESARRDELRLTLASEGLPANGAQGYELLDNLSGFGTTSQMFDAAYWRAKEGELARTIVASPHIRYARVHIAAASAQPFRRESEPTASVTATASAGTLSASQAKAIKFMVAAAVTGLAPENVSVIDGEAGVVLALDEEESSSSGVDERTELLKRNVERLIEARVGAGNAVVEVNLETVTDREQIVERRFDPEGRVAISTDTEERTTSATDSGNTGVTVASNLPDGDAAGGGSNSESQNSETRERVNFEVSETTRELVRAPGAVKRVSVAVLVDGIRDGNSWAPRPEEELESLRALVSSAVGFDEARGDVITIRTMEFQPVTPLGTEALPSFFQRMSFDLMSLIQLLVLSLVVIALGMFVIRPILTSAPTPALAELAPPAEGEAGEALDGELADIGLPGGALGTVDNFDTGDMGELPALPGLDAMGGFGGAPDTGDAASRLKALISERQDETVEILRSWMDEPGEKV